MSNDEKPLPMAAELNQLADFLKTVKPMIESLTVAENEAETLLRQVHEMTLDEVEDYLRDHPINALTLVAFAEAAHKRQRAEAFSAIGAKAAEVRHNQPGGSRERQQAIRDAWASGKYSSRDRCAEEECGSLNMSFSAARKALRNTPDPS